jgi:hypothetical protein
MVERGYLNEARELKAQGTLSQRDNFKTRKITFNKASIYFSNATSK